MELKDAFEDYHLYLSVVQRKSKKTVQSYLLRFFKGSKDF